MPTLQGSLRYPSVNIGMTAGFTKLVSYISVSCLISIFKMKVEIDLTKSQVDKLRRLIGLKTQTRADVVLKSFVKMVVDDPDALEIIQYDQRT
ncbi:hypothetical protein N9L50_03975 [Flavobacteriaceae bacterium]|nr:hypothetical protein [Flavobacteriaceae bacterium]